MFTFSPYQKICHKKLFQLSAKLAQQLHQDSIALVEFDNQNSMISKDESILYSVVFGKDQPPLKDILENIQQLPNLYKNAYSLQISDLKQVFSDAKVTKITWLGHGFDSEVLKQAFPTGKIIIRKGTGWLVYNDNRVEEL